MFNFTVLPTEHRLHQENILHPENDQTLLGVLLKMKAFVYYYYQFGYIYQLAFQYSNHALLVPKHVVFPGYQI